MPGIVSVKPSITKIIHAFLLTDQAGCAGESGVVRNSETPADFWNL